MGKQCYHFFSAIVDQILFIFVSRFCLFCAFTRPRYQVSVYRTIGHLVLFHHRKYLCHERNKMRPLYLLEKKHTNKTPNLYSVFQANAKTNKNITPKREHKLSVRNRQLLVMLWLRTYPTSYMSRDVRKQTLWFPIRSDKTRLYSQRRGRDD